MWTTHKAYLEATESARLFGSISGIGAANRSISSEEWDQPRDAGGCIKPPQNGNRLY
jgi:hypothetical protein